MPMNGDALEQTTWTPKDLISSIDEFEALE